MYKILVHAGTRPAGSKVTIDGIGSITVGEWHIVTDAQEERFSLLHPSKRYPSLLGAFRDSEDVEVEVYVPTQEPKSAKAGTTKLPKQEEKK